MTPIPILAAFYRAEHYGDSTAHEIIALWLYLRGYDEAAKFWQTYPFMRCRRM